MKETSLLMSKYLSISVMGHNVFENFFNKHYPSICTFAYAYVKDHQTAEDIAEDCFLKLWQQNIAFTHPNQVKSWLYRVARNAALDCIKKQKREQDKFVGHAYHQSMETEDFKLKQMIRAEVMTEIYQVIDTLPAACRKVFTMFYFEGKNLKKIAEELNLSIHTIKCQKAKGLAILREKLPPLAFSIVISACI